VLQKKAVVEAGLREALATNGFELYYQPQVDHMQQVIGAEALLRWRPPGRPMVQPGDFIPVAEETGLILPIGQWVLETACAQLAAWAKLPEMRDLALAINVSSRQFRQPGFVAQVAAALEASGADPTRLKLELTESMVLDDIEGTVSKMHALRDMGVRFALDDFGTGYSSLSYLKRLPLDQIKIDQSFVRDIATDPSDAAIVQTIISISHTLRLQVVAEGVEVIEQHAFLEANRCALFQGYLFGRPMALTDFERMLTASQESQLAGEETQ
jgi:EAL domain-containing protein (putative c-di-GMP-specific phosphodiesterase class I)